jgi:hypothetical protein
MSKKEFTNRNDRIIELIELIQKEFPSHEINTEHEISVIRPKAITRKRDRRISFFPSGELLADQDSNFISRFNEGIKMARIILDHPPFEDRIYQGDVVMMSNSVVFKQRKR